MRRSFLKTIVATAVVGATMAFANISVMAAIALNNNAPATYDSTYTTITGNSEDGVTYTYDFAKFAKAVNDAGANGGSNYSYKIEDGVVTGTGGVSAYKSALNGSVFYGLDATGLKVAKNGSTYTEFNDDSTSITVKVDDDCKATISFTFPENSQQIGVNATDDKNNVVASIAKGTHSNTTASLNTTLSSGTYTIKRNGKLLFTTMVILVQTDEGTGTGGGETPEPASSDKGTVAVKFNGGIKSVTLTNKTDATAAPIIIANTRGTNSTTAISDENVPVGEYSVTATASRYHIAGNIADITVTKDATTDITVTSASNATTGATLNAATVAGKTCTWDFTASDNDNGFIAIENSGLAIDVDVYSEEYDNIFFNYKGNKINSDDRANDVQMSASSELKFYLTTGATVKIVSNGSVAYDTNGDNTADYNAGNTYTYTGEDGYVTFVCTSAQYTSPYLKSVQVVYPKAFTKDADNKKAIYIDKAGNAYLVVGISETDAATATALNILNANNKIKKSSSTVYTGVSVNDDGTDVALNASDINSKYVFGLKITGAGASAFTLSSFNGSFN